MIYVEQMEGPHSQYILTVEQLKDIKFSYDILAIIHDMFKNMTLNDVNSICTETLTELADNFTQYIKNVEIFVPNKIPCFWSCEDGKQQALAQQKYSTDADYPIIKLLFQYCTTIRDQMKCHSLFMTFFFHMQFLEYMHHMS